MSELKHFFRRFKHYPNS